jgi:hypothetical protein
MRRPLLALALLAASAVPAIGYEEPIWRSYTRVSPDKAFVFVMLHTRRDGEEDTIADKYPHSGLYRNDGSAVPLWQFNDGYVRDAYPASDGVHVVVQYLRVISPDPRTCGNSPPEPPANPVVLGVYANGKKVRDVNLGELLDHVAFCREHGPGWHPWMDSAHIDDEAGTFVVDTGDRRTALSLDTGRPTYGLAASDDAAESGGVNWLLLVLGVSLGVATVAGTAAVAVVLLQSVPRPAE